MPLVSRTFDQLINFTRTSAATFVGSNGLIQTTPASVNLLLYTQDFDIATWNKGGGSVIVTANSTTAPDGTSTADTITESVGGTTHNIYQNATVVSGSAYTWSGYVKANGRSIVQVNCQATTTIYTAEFDLTAVTVTNRSGTGTATITDVGNGWYRVTATATSTGAGTGYWQINLCSAANTISYSGNGTSGVFLWGAQLEVGSTATTYTRNFGGLFPPRFDYNPVTLAPLGLLIEEQRVNLVTYSAAFDNAAWPKSNATVVANQGVSPDGTTTADLLYPTTTGSSRGIIRGTDALLTNGTVYTQSVYVKAAGKRWVLFNGVDATNVDNSCYFDLQTGTIGVQGSAVTNATIVNAGGGWYRITATGAAGANDYFLLQAVDANGSSNTTTNGTDGVLIWGAQLEAGAGATSYIPTVASQVTRAGEIANISAPNFAPWYNQSEGTLMAEYSSFATTVAASKAVTASYDGTGNNRLMVYLFTDAPAFTATVGGATQALLSTTGVTANSVVKSAVAFRTNDFAFSTNGSAALTDTSGSLPVTNALAIGSLAGSIPLNGHVRRIVFYPTRLTNAQIQALST